MSKLNLVLWSSDLQHAPEVLAIAQKPVLILLHSAMPFLSNGLYVSSWSFLFFTWILGKNYNSALFYMPLCSYISRNIENKWKHSKSNELYRGMILSDR